MAEGADRQLLNPLDFARDVLGVELWEKQKEVSSALQDNRRVAVKSGNGLGKDYCAAVAVLWFLYCHDPAIVLSTAPTFRQVRHVLWRQIRRLHRLAPDILGGKVLDTRWELAEDRYAIGLSADTADQFQGFHSPNMFIVVDEAEGVSDEIYEAVESVMTSASPRLLLIGNPTTVTGAFRRAFYQERRLYYTVTISALDSPNVKAEKVLISGLTTAEWVEERRETWGENNPIYRARILGEFPDEANEAVETEETVLAVDVARFGSDRSVILRRRGNRVEDNQTFQKLDTMQLAGWVVAAIKECPPDRMYIDEIGVGAGVVDRLREQGFNVRGINVARRARQETIFTNTRSEGYWKLRELFASRQIRIPRDSQLMGELAALRYSYDSQGRIYLESKEAMRGRGLPSPDKADALMLAFVEQGHRTRLWT